MIRLGDRLMIHRVENANDAPFDVDGLGHRDFAFEQVADGLGDHGLPVSRRSVTEHRVPGSHSRPDLIEDAVAQDQMGERGAHARPAHLQCSRFTIRVQVILILTERDRRQTEADLSRLYVRASSGEAVPLSSVVSSQEVWVRGLP